MKPLQKLTVFWVSVVVMLCVLRPLEDLPSGVAARVEIEGTIASGNVIEIYVNRDYYTPFQTPILPGEPTVYVIKEILKNIRNLRIDLGKVDGAAVELRRIDIFVDTRRVRHFGPDQLLKMVESQSSATAGPPHRTPDAISYVQRSHGPSFIIDEPIELGHSGILVAVAQFVGDLRSNSGILFYSFVALGLVVLTTLDSPHIVVTLLLGIGAIILTIFIIPKGVALVDVPDSVRYAVGRAAFVGRSSLANQVALWTAGAAAIVFSLLVVVLTRHTRLLRFTQADHPVGADILSDTRHKRWSGVAALLACIFLLSYFVAAALPKIVHDTTEVFSANWDKDNILLWRFLVHEGYQPLIDYWYPYGGTWLFSLPAPTGQLFQIIYYTTVYVILFLSLYCILQGRIQPSILITLAVLIGWSVHFFFQASRYLVAVNIVLSYVAIGEPRTRFSWRHLLFVCSVAIALIFEPIQAFYASAGIIVHIICDLGHLRWGTVRMWLRRASIEFGPVAIVVVVWSCVLWSRGELWPVIAFHLSIPVGATYVSIPTDLNWVLHGGFTAGSLTLVAPHAMIAIGLYGSFQGTQQRRTAGMVLVLLGFTVIMMLQKSIIRDMATILIMPVYLALMIWAALEPRFQKSVPLVIGGLTMAAVLFGTQQTTTPLLWRLLAGPGNAIADMYKLVTSEEPARSARLNAFTSSQFVNFQMENQVVERLRALGAGSTAPVYVLGDTPVLYILLRQPPPYHSNDYNASPIFDQRRVVEWLETTRPAFVVWRQGDLSFDGFARAVRVPLIYSAVAAEYVPLEMIGSFTVLRRRQAGEPPAIAWWREHLTPTVELGSILRRTGAADQPTCARTDFTTCMRVLRVELPAEVRSSRRVVIPFSVGEYSFEIAFTSHPLQESYFIALEHMWFWAMARAANLEPTVLSSLEGRIRIEEMWKKRDENILY